MASSVQNNKDTTSSPEVIEISSEDDEESQPLRKRLRANCENCDTQLPKEDPELEQMKEVHHLCYVSFFLFALTLHGVTNSNIDHSDFTLMSRDS